MHLQKRALEGRRGFAVRSGMYQRALIALLAAGLPLVCQGTDISYWVWKRTTPLSQGEIGELRSQNVTTLYWDAGEISNAAGNWKWKAAPQRQSIAGLVIVPVVRISSVGKDAFSDASIKALVEKLRPVAADGKELQIDFDCPDRLLGEYAKALKTIHAVVPKLTITALTGWSSSREWAELQGSVDEIFPMFYDEKPDVPLPQGVPQSLLDPGPAATQIASWGGCKIPWMAGLPAFARLTLFDAQGKSMGTIRQWGWDDICFNKCLITDKSPPGGVTVFKVLNDGVVADTPVKKGETLVARMPSRAALSATADAAQKAGARGIIYFRMPDSTNPSGWSLKQMGHLSPDETPRLVLREKTPGRLALANDSSADLEPRLSGTGGMDRGYALELDAGAPVFREATGGDFWKVTGYVNPDTKPALVAIPLATRLTFWFSHLRAGESLDCGLIQLAPGVAFKQIRYRVLQKGDTWHSIE